MSRLSLRRRLSPPCYAACLHDRKHFLWCGRVTDDLTSPRLKRSGEIWWRWAAADEAHVYHRRDHDHRSAQPGAELGEEGVVHVFRFACCHMHGRIWGGEYRPLT